jgi:phenol 2-monooxygenase
MQFHLNGFRAGDPAVAEGGPIIERLDALPAEVDVLIVGCGPAGLTLAAQLAAFPDIRTLIVEQKDGPLLFGQADGIACRTVEMFQAFGFAQQVLPEAYWVNEVTFWRPDAKAGGAIARSGRVQDTEDGLSEFPHVILSQARVHEHYLRIMREGPARIAPAYGRRLTELQIDDRGVTACLEQSGGAAETVRARFVVGCDGARSAVRRQIGVELRGDSANQAWAVMDILAVTDFPDFRFKCMIQSAGEGSILIIPREGGYMCRLYIEMEGLAPGERVADRGITAEKVVARAQRIMHPYTLDVREIAWWSVYEIGQRISDRFDNLTSDDAQAIPRVFIAGDACHTHSPKAGQGMNVSMQDTFNLGWKLAAVLRGQAAPALLRSYSAERQAIARELIDFDREWAAILGQPADTPEKAALTQDYFTRHGRYTAGTATRYAPSTLTSASARQDLATGLTVGMRFHSAPVIRLGDSKPMELGHVATADARWRLYAFAGHGDLAQAGGQIRALCDHLARDPASALRRHTPSQQDADAIFDLRAVFQDAPPTLVPADLPELLFPAKGKLGLRDFEKAFRVDPHADIYDLRGIDRAHGCLVVVRPDQYVGHILPLDDYTGLAAYFDGILLG